MTLARAVIAACFLLILGIPFALRPSAEHTARDVPALVVITPHVQQIREEYGVAFARWHEQRYGSPVRVDFRTPGGTTDILRQLEAVYVAAIKGGRIRPGVDPEPGVVGFDLMFGGGTFDHGRVKAGVKVAGPGGDVTVPMSVPAGFPQKQLDEWYGENRVGSQPLYDPDQYWLGVALSAFGIVYNRDVLARLGIPEPRTYEDLTDPRLTGWVALADPRQSGSVATSFDSILSNAGWERGWRILREMCANTRYFTSASTKPPLDVSAGEAAAGLAIDFYGRGQSQAVMRPGETPQTSRVGYVDPAGTVYIDADPVSILRGGPHPELARRFVEFCLTEEGQALWQFRASRDNPIGEDGAPMGPRRYELRRAPARRVMYQKYMAYFVDQSDPFKIASPVAPKGWRGAIGVMMGAFAIDIADDQRAAWRALNRARAGAAAGRFPRERLEEMERLFYAWPETTFPDGAVQPFTEANCKAILAAWKQPGVMPGARIEYTRFFRDNYRRILEIGRAR